MCQCYKDKDLELKLVVTILVGLWIFSILKNINTTG